MDKHNYSAPVSLKNIQVTDTFWKGEMELVRKEVIPYQWDALNDRVEGAAPSFCMHNFKAAGKLNREKKEKGNTFIAPKYTYRGFEVLPEDPKQLKDDEFYGFLFQDSDFSKWIEAVGYSLTQHPDPELEKIADGAIDIVCAAQQDDGYLDTYYILSGRDATFTNLKDHHELYCFGHLIEGAVAYFQATGKDKLLKAAERFADYVAANFGTEEGKLHGYPGHEIAEMALVRLYELTGKEKYLNLARYFVDERGKRPYYFDQEHPEEVKKGHEDELRYFYNQAHLPVRKQDEAFGHSVRAVYLYSGMADVARLTGDETLYGACRRLWDNITEKKMYVTGGIGSTHLGEAFTYAYDLPNDTAYAETCASIGLVFFARRQGMQTLWNAHFIMAYSAAWRWMERAFSMSIRWKYCRRHVIRMNENFMSSRFARNGSAAHAVRLTWRVCSARSVPMPIRKTGIRCFCTSIWEAPWKRRSAKRQQISVWNPTSPGRGM